MRCPKDGVSPSSRSASSTACTGAISASSHARRSSAGARAAGRGDHLRPASGRGDQAGQPPAVPVLGPPPRRAARRARRGRGVRAPVHRSSSPGLTPTSSCATVLVERLHAAAVVVGEDFRFGHKAAGDVAAARQARREVRVHHRGLPLLVADGVTISSTAIRALLAAGDVAAAAKALGRPHRVEGVVVRGHQRGRAARLPDRQPGVAAAHRDPRRRHLRGLAGHPGRGRAETSRWPAAISIGTNPTFGAGGDRTVEAYALDRTDLDLYGLHAAIDFASGCAAPALRLDRGPGRADAPRRRPGRESALPNSQPRAPLDVRHEPGRRRSRTRSVSVFARADRVLTCMVL